MQMSKMDSAVEPRLAAAVMQRSYELVAMDATQLDRDCDGVGHPSRLHGEGGARRLGRTSGPRGQAGTSPRLRPNAMLSHCTLSRSLPDQQQHRSESRLGVMFVAPRLICGSLSTRGCPSRWRANTVMGCRDSFVCGCVRVGLGFRSGRHIRHGRVARPP